MTGNINTKEHWDKQYAEQGAYQDFMTDWFELAWKPYLQRFLTTSKKLRILEIACGIGNCSDVAGKLNHIVIGTDLSSVAIDQCKIRYGSNDNCRFVDMSAEQALDCYKNNDVIMAFEILEHFDNPVPTIQRVSKALKEDGMFLFSVPTENGKNGVLPCHYNYWNYETAVKIMFRHFKTVEFFNCYGFEDAILGVARK